MAAVEGMRSPVYEAVLRYLKTVARPFNPPADFGKCPVNYNSAPSFQTTTATTKYSGSAATLAGTTTEMILFPGHASLFQDSSTGGADPFAFHASLIALGVGATIYSVGPIDANFTGPTVPSAIGAMATGLSLGASTNAFVGAGTFAINPMSSLPYLTTGGNNHSRWKLLSMGIKIFNDTPLVDRGGYIGSCQPNSPFSAATQTAYSVFGSYQTSVASTDGVETIVWIPRTEDLAFWHTINGGATNMSVAGIRVWFNNDTAKSQNWRYEVVCHWELAGTSLASITTPALALPSGKDIVEPALDVVKAASPSGSVLDKVGAAIVAAHTGPAVFSGAVKGFSSGGVMGAIGGVLKSVL